MGKRREPRMPVELVVRILGTDAAGKPFMEKVNALDASRCGLRVRGLAAQLELEGVVSVSYKDQKGRYRVKWTTAIATPVGPSHWEVGLEALSSDRSIFDFPLPTPVIDNYAGPASNERRSAERLRCTTSAEIHPVHQATSMRVSVGDISPGGCFIDMPMPLHKGTQLKIALWLGDVKITADAEVTNVRPGFGMGLHFTCIAAEEQAKLNEYLAKIPKFPFQRSK